jgi:uncharacterized membrane protein YebE (DUF533 family)
MSKLEELKKAILADGVIDKDEVAQLKTALYADGKIDKEEADFLFELNDAVSGKANDTSWTTLFVDAITDYLLEDGQLDEDEKKWLAEKVQGDGQVDKVEQALIDNLKSKGFSI